MFSSNHSTPSGACRRQHFQAGADSPLKSDTFMRDCDYLKNPMQGKYLPLPPTMLPALGQYCQHYPPGCFKSQLRVTFSAFCPGPAGFRSTSPGLLRQERERAPFSSKFAKADAVSYPRIGSSPFSVMYPGFLAIPSSLY